MDKSYLIPIEYDVKTYAPLRPNTFIKDTPIVFKNSNRAVGALPVNELILNGDQPFYSTDDIKNNKDIFRIAHENSVKNKIRKYNEKSNLCIRSTTDIPCAICFLLSTAFELFKKLEVDPEHYYIIFLTYDEIQLYEKDSTKLSTLKKNIISMKNKMRSIYPDSDPIFLTEVFEYDAKQKKYVEV